MPICLHPITESEYPSWFSNHTQSYAADKIRAKQWSEKGALEQAKNDTQRFLTAGVNTPNNYLCHIVDQDSGVRVGALWWCLSERFGRRVAFVFDIHIHQEYRRRGYATETLRHLEKRANVDNLDAISLHVFAFNKNAIQLYKKMGFATTSMSLTKEL